MKQPVLIMIQGPEPGSLYKLPDNRATTIGRSSRNTIRSVSSNVSRFHCEVSWVNGRWELTDLNSKKGTIVNGELITDIYPLEPGDIIRLGTTVFRFDTIDETMMDDGAMVALVEAELNQKLLTRGEATASLDDIRARSRMEGRDSRRVRERKRASLKTNLAFLAAVAVAVGIVVTGVLAYAHRRAVGTPGWAARRERQARALYERAVAARQAEGPAAALAKLRLVAQRYPATEAATDAARAASDVVWSEVQAALEAALRAEAEGDFAAALRAYARLDELAPGRQAADLLKRRLHFTVRLAHAAFRVAQSEAQRRADAGEPRAAADMYRSLADRIGVPELASSAREAADELDATGPP